MTITHNWLSKHKYSAIAVPAAVADRINGTEPFELIQKDGSVIMVKYVDRWSNFQIDRLPGMLTLILFGIDTRQMKAALQRAWPELTKLQASEQIISFVAVEKV